MASIQSCDTTFSHWAFQQSWRSAVHCVESEQQLPGHEQMQQFTHETYWTTKKMCYAWIRYNLLDNSANLSTLAIAGIQFQFLHFCLLHCLSSLPEGAQIPTLNTSLSPQPGPPQCHLFDGCLGQKSRQGSATGKTVERKMPRKKTTKASTSSTDIVLQCFTCVQFTL